MPLHPIRDDASRRIVFTVYGQSTVAELAGVIARLVEEGLWRYGVLYDVTAPGAALPDVRQMAHTLGILDESIREHGPCGPIVFAATDPEMYERARLYVDCMVSTLRFSAAAFRGLGEAVAWLNAALERQQAQDD